MDVDGDVVGHVGQFLRNCRVRVSEKLGYVGSLVADFEGGEFAGGGADVVALVDVPDDQRSVATAVAFGALNWSSGMAESMRVTWLTTPEEFEAALKTASSLAAPGEEK